MKKGILVFVLIIMALANCITPICLAVSIDPIIKPPESTEIDDKAIEIVNKALGVVSIVGVAIALGMLIFVGIKLMSVAPSERSEAKKHLTIFVIGAVCILGAIFIMTLLGDFSKELLSGSGLK